MSGGSWPGEGRVCSIGWGGLNPSASLVCLPLALLLSACAGTPWGDRLSASFPPAEEPVVGARSPASGVLKPGAAPSAAPGTATAVQAVKPGAGQPIPSSSPPAPPGAAPAPAPGSRPLVPKGGPATKPLASAPPASDTTRPPVPYRVTLRLPRADPSAPAEAVTRALRAAGIPFEVETIERVQGGATAPSARPAPPPR